MRTFTIDADNNISAYANKEEAVGASASPSDSFTNEKELTELATTWPADRLVAIWNSLTGVTPVKKFKDRQTAISRIWKQIQALGKIAEPTVDPVEKRKAQRKAKGGAPAGKGAAPKGKSGKTATTAQKVHKTGPKAKSLKSAAPPREGSKTAQVVEMLRRKNGATLAEIMDKMGWQKHTVRGFVAGAMKKAGHTVESFKPDNGERTYRITK